LGEKEQGGRKSHSTGRGAPTKTKKRFGGRFSERKAHVSLKQKREEEGSRRRKGEGEYHSPRGGFFRKTPHQIGKVGRKGAVGGVR